MDVLKKPNLKVRFSYGNISDTGYIPKIYEQFEERIQYNFKNKGLLLQAFTHSTFQSVLHVVLDKKNIKDMINNLEASFK